MDIVWILQRRPTRERWMFGDLDCAGEYACKTLEDELREVKVAADTAIAAGRYELDFRDSPSLGRDAIWIKDVRNFRDIYLHSGVDETSTRGCPLVGDQIDEANGRISGGLARGVLARLKAMLRLAKANGDRVFLEVRNAPGDRYVDTGELAGGAAA